MSRNVKAMTKLKAAVKAKREEIAEATPESTTGTVADISEAPAGVAGGVGSTSAAVVDMGQREPKLPVSKVVSTFFEPLVREALTDLAEGSPLSKTARRHAVPTSVLRKYLWQNHRSEYDKAMRDGADQLAEQAVMASAEIAKAEEEIETTYADGSTTKAVKRFDNVQRSKLKAEALWKLAACKDPERYGTKGKSEEDTSMAQAIMAARKRISHARADDQ